MKFEVGVLVVMSAAGNKNLHNGHLVDGWGIIKKIKCSRRYRDHFPIEAEWYDGVGFGNDFARSVCFKPYELKKFKK